MSHNFSDLLQAGEIDSAIDLRLDTLEGEAKYFRVNSEAAKISSAALAVVGLALSANPLLLVLGGLGAAGYVWAVAKDSSRTGRLRPIPGSRKGIAELFEGIAGAASGQTEAAVDPLHQTMSCLTPELAHEYELLAVSDGPVFKMLNAIQPEKRIAGYRHILRQTRLRDSLLLPALADVQAAIVLPAAPETTPTIGSDTRLNAIDVPTLPQDSAAPTAVVEDRWWEGQPADTATATKPAHPVDHLIGDRLRTSLIVSVSGGGKDILLSNALRSFLSSHPGFKVIVMDCKDDPKEIGYYANLPGVRLHRLNVAIASDAEVVQWVDRCIDEFLKLPERALLINNEGTLIRAKSKRYVAAIDGLVSSGDSREKYAWEAGQSAHIDDLKINGAARSRFRLIIIGLLGEQLQVDAVLKAQCVADAAKKPEVIEAEMRRSPVQRAWCDGLQWYPMPVLENYSGYNRDARVFVANNTVTPADARAQLESLYQREGTSEQLPNFPEVLEAGKAASQNSEGAGSTEEVDFPRSDDWRKYFPEAPREVEEVIFRAYFSALEAGKRKQDFIADFLQGGTGGRRYQAAAKYLDYLEAKYKS